MDSWKLRALRNSMASLVLVSLLLTLAPTRRASAGTIIFVKAGASGANNGTSWANAYRSLQSALGAAAFGSEIWVAKGTYRPTGGSDQTISFQLKDGVQIYGGFAGTETDRSQRNFKLNATVLSGDIGVVGASNDNSFHVVRALNLTDKTVLDGFTITGGNASKGYPDYWGAGLYNATDGSTNGNITLQNLEFVGNNALYAGGGMFNDHGSPILTNVSFAGNFAGQWGGGFYGLNGSPQLKKVIFNTNFAFDNSASAVGGGMALQNVSVFLTDVTFDGNFVDGATGNNQGGALFIDNSFGSFNRVTFSNNTAHGTNGAGGAIFNHNGSTLLVFDATFFNNTADWRGGAVYHNSSAATYANATFVGNTAGSGGGDALYINTASSATVQESILWGSTGQLALESSITLDLKDVVIPGGCPSGNIVTCAHLISSDPKLGVLKNNGKFTKTMAPGAGSSAIDAGGINASCLPADQRGVTRPQGLRCDIGAYEVHAKKLVSQAVYDGYITESGVSTNVGGATNNTATTLRVGDDAQNRRYRAILSFDTTPIPVGSTIIRGLLMAQRSSTTGNPSATLGALTVDVAAPFFGKRPDLTVVDFSATPSAPAVTVMAPAGGLWYAGTLNASGAGWAGAADTVQFRLRFAKALHNGAADYFSFFSGNASTAASRPVLWVFYNP